MEQTILVGDAAPLRGAALPLVVQVLGYFVGVALMIELQQPIKGFPCAAGPIV